MEQVEFKYPTREEHKAAGFSYASDMVHLAVYRDDADTFMRFLEECGGPDCEALLAGSVVNYAAIHGAAECVRALFADGVKERAGHNMEYWLKKAEKPVYGHKAVQT